MVFFILHSLKLVSKSISNRRNNFLLVSSVLDLTFHYFKLIVFESVGSNFIDIPITFCTYFK